MTSRSYWHGHEIEADQLAVDGRLKIRERLKNEARSRKNDNGTDERGTPYETGQ